MYVSLKNKRDRVGTDRQNNMMSQNAQTWTPECFNVVNLSCNISESAIVFVFIISIGQAISETLLGNFPTNDDCVLENTTLTCSRIPKTIPDKAEHVVLKKIDIQYDMLNFDGRGWEHVTTLNIISSEGDFFRHNEKQPVFAGLPNLRQLKIHGKNLNHLDSETLLGLPNLEKLDLSSNVRLELRDVKKLFTLNSSLINLRELNIGFLHSNPVILDENFLSNLGKRPIEILELQGLVVLNIEYQGMHELCDSLKTLNLSAINYFPNSVLGETDPPFCTSLTTLDFSRTPTKQWAFNYLHTSMEKELMLNLQYLPALRSFYANELNYDFPDWAIRENSTYKCSGCKNLENLKYLYLKKNRIEWLNVSCEDCDKFQIELIDLSSNGLEYLSQNFISSITTLEDINLSDNKLSVMQYYDDFEMLFLTFSRLQRINLSRNNLTFLPRYMFANNSNLKMIDLANNKLTSLDLFIKHLHKLNFLSVSGNPIKTMSSEDMTYFSTRFNDEMLDFELDLSKIMFICDCDRSHFVRWLFVTLVQRRKADIKCMLEGMVVPIDNNARIKSEYLCEKSSIIIVSAMLSVSFFIVIFVMTIFAMVFIKRKRLEMKRNDFIQRFKGDKGNNKYLLFVIFCQTDEVLLDAAVLPVLSDCFGKLLGSKDKLIGVGFNEFRLGLPIIDETERCIRQSSAVVILYSRASTKCARCRREVKIAYEKDKPTAIIDNGPVEQEQETHLLKEVIKKASKVRLIEAKKKVYFASDPMEFCEAVINDIVANGPH